MGAVGGVPSGGNLVPDVWQALYECGKRGDHEQAEAWQRRADQISAVYQRGRFSRRSIAALKATMGALGLCGPDVLPPLLPLTQAEQEEVRREFLAMYRDMKMETV